jgi:hypothetical protein
MRPARALTALSSVRSRSIALVVLVLAVLVTTVFLVGIMGGTRPGPPLEADAAAGCRFFKVTAETLNLFKEPRSASDFVGRLDKNDIVCAVRDQQVGDLLWTFVVYQLQRGGQRKAMENWAIKRFLAPATSAEVTALRASEAGPPPPAQPPAPAPLPAPAPEAVQFSEPITFGPPPVKGHSLQELIAGTPLFPPIAGLDESVWKKTCNNCHKWDRETLCAQANVYLKNPQAALRVAHPYGGPEKTAMMKWAEGGCQ